MKQLSGSDNLFLTQEKGNQTAHVGGLSIYDPSTAPGGVVRFKSILDFYARRLHSSKIFRRRLVHAPFGLDRPYWIDDADIDVEYHIRHIALPQPGDWRQLCIQVARLHARGLDLSKPAWEVYVIEGLDNIPGVPKGSFATYSKFHHAAIDGEAAAVLTGALHSLSPEPDMEPPQPQTLIVDRDPTSLELMARMVGNRIEQVRIAASIARDIAPLALSLGRKQVTSWRGAGKGGKAASDPPEDKQVPTTRFNAPISPHRVIESIPLSLSDCQTIRASFPGVTINDIFLATSGGAVRKYLESKGELPAATLRALVPISTRGANTGADASNQLAMAVMPVFSQIADAAERLEKVNEGSRREKKQVEAIGKDLPARLGAIVPAYVVDKLLHKFVVRTFNMTVSNVRGPDVPLYMAGARLHALMPINMLFDGLGLSITGFSYNGVLWVCAVADRKMMPDPAFFARCFKESFAELLAAAATRSPPAPPAKAEPGARSAKARPGKKPARYPGPRSKEYQA